MSKELIIIRHADAEEPYSGQRDLDRELTSSGFMKAGRMGEFMAEMKLNPDLMVVSPAARTLSTARFIAERTGFSEHLIQTPEGLHNASPRTLLDIVCNLPKAAHRVMLIGHNPGISYLAEYFSGADIGYLSPGGVVSIGFDAQTWKELSQRSGRLLWQKTFDL